MKSTTHPNRAVRWVLFAWLIGAALLVVVSAGCGTAVGGFAKDTFTNPTGDITIRRQQFINTYARLRELYLVIHAEAIEACRTEKLSAKKCLEIGEVHEQAKQLDFDVRAVIGVPETELDWAMIEKVLGFAVKLVL